jgi:ABC-2 type transport system permease protein
MTLPVSPMEAILGKFFAAWAFIGLALVLTFPMWITVNALGDPDNGVILTSYLGSFLMAGAFLAIGSFVSAMTKNQVIAFIIAATIAFLFTMSGFEMVQNAVKAWLPEVVTQAISSMSVLSHFERITRGVLEAPTLVYFLSMIAFFLFATGIAVDQKKAE